MLKRLMNWLFPKPIIPYHNCFDRIRVNHLDDLYCETCGRDLME